MANDHRHDKVAASVVLLLHTDSSNEDQTV